MAGGRSEPADTDTAGNARFELPALAGLLVLATLARFIDLPSRGMWDADQGHDMLVLGSFVQRGVIPLLGPPTSLGGVHHGALYYYLLAPFAALTGANPTAVVAAIAGAGVATVGLVWWMARSIAGPLAGLGAALLMAVSASAVGESTFIWNPNLLGLASAIAFAAAWRAWNARDPRWWVIAAGGLASTMQLHILGAVLVVPFVGLFVADVRRRDSAARRPMVDVGLLSLLVVALFYAPLIAYELGHGFAESRAAIAFLSGASGTESGAPNVVVRVVVVALRVLSWPLSGVITDQPLAAFLATVAVIALLVWRLRSGNERERQALAWLGATLGWSIVVLAVVAPSLATVVPGLPNDHYHAYLDPIVIVIVGIGLARLVSTARVRAPDAHVPPADAHVRAPEARSGSSGPVATAVGALILISLVMFNVWTWPPRVAPDGGWPAAENAARDVLATIGGRDYVLLGIPAFKPTDALGFPLIHLGRGPSPSASTDTVDRSTAIVVVCDRLFEPIVGAACGGPAESAALASIAPLNVVRQIEVSPRTVVSIYAAADAARR